MTKNIKIIAFYYLITFTLTMISGLKSGFTGSHTPPMPFILGLFFFVIGFIWILSDLILLVIKHRGRLIEFIAHILGLSTYGFFILYLIADQLKSWP